MKKVKIILALILGTIFIEGILAIQLLRDNEFSTFIFMILVLLGSIIIGAITINNKKSF